MNQEINKAFKYAFFGNWWVFVITIVDIVACICTILGVSIKDFSPLWVTIGSFLIFITALSCIIFRFVRRINRGFELKDSKIQNIKIQLDKSNKELLEVKDYLSFIHILADSISAINKMTRNGKITEVTFQKEMLIFCNKLKESFEMLNNKTNTDKSRKYSVSIKVIISEVIISKELKTDDIEVVNSFRNTSSFQDEFRIDSIYDKTHHYISKNTAYKTIIDLILDESKYCYYINNNIQEDKFYKNSSIDCYINHKIPYKSELVMPILPLCVSQESLALLGFLCITCNDSGGFDLNDKEIKCMLSVADCLYNIMLKWQKNRWTQEQAY